MAKLNNELLMIKVEPFLTQPRLRECRMGRCRHNQINCVQDEDKEYSCAFRSTRIDTDGYCDCLELKEGEE